MVGFRGGLNAALVVSGVLLFGAIVQGAMPQEASAQDERRSPLFVEKSLPAAPFETEPVVSVMEAVSEAIEVTPTTNEEAAAAAMATVMEALNADGVEMETASLDADSEQMQPVPGATDLFGLESAGLEISNSAPDVQLPFDSVALNLATTSAAFSVNSDSVPALRAALNSENPLTQLYAADALWMLTGDSDLVLPTLMEAAVSGEEEAQDLAIAAIAQMGKEALPAVPLLNDLAGDTRTRRIAADAIAVINSEDRPSTLLGIIARESRRILIPRTFRAIGHLF